VGRVFRTPQSFRLNGTYDTMSELERRELYQMLSGLAAVQPIDAEVDEPDGTYYEYDRNLKATVKVTPDGERTPVAAARQPFERPQKKPAQKCPRRDDNLSQPKPTLSSRNTTREVWTGR